MTNKTVKSVFLTAQVSLNVWLVDFRTDIAIIVRNTTTRRKTLKPLLYILRKHPFLLVPSGEEREERDMFSQATFYIDVLFIFKRGPNNDHY